MKTIKPFQIFIGTFLICSFLFFSCRVSKTTALKCPQVSTKENNEVLVKYKKNKNTTFTPKYRANIRKEPVKQLISLLRNNHGKYTDVFNNSPIHENVMVSGPAYLNGLTKIEYNKRLTASIDETVIPLRKNYLTRFQTEKAETTDHPIKKIVIPVAGCDTIILKNGKSILCKVVSVGQSRITYMDCHDTFIPVISISKSKVSTVKYSNSTPVSITASEEKPETTNPPADKIVIATDRCDTIIFKSGYSVICKVMEIGENILSYRKCDDLRGPVTSILKSDVSEIRNSNGGKIFVTSSYLSSSLGNNKERKTEGFGFVGFLLSLIGLISSGIYVINILLQDMYVFGLSPYFFYYIMIPTGYLAILLGIIGLIRIGRNQNKYKGKALAKLSLIIGISILSILTLGSIIVAILFIMTL